MAGEDAKARELYFREQTDPESAQEQPELDRFRGEIRELSGPIEGLATDLIVCFESGDDSARDKIQELIDTYKENVGAFFGKLFGNDAFSEIKLVVTARDVWKKSIEKLDDEECVFIFEKMLEEPSLRALLPDSTRAAIEDPDFEATPDNVRRLVNTITNPNQPDDIVFLQRAFHQGIDPLAAIGGSHKERYAEKFPEVSALLLQETRTAHHKGAMAIGFEASKLAKRDDLNYDDLSPQEKSVVLWTTTATLTTMYGSEFADTPQETWRTSTEPAIRIIDQVMATEEDDPETVRALAALTPDSDMDFETFHAALMDAVERGGVTMDSLALFRAGVAEQYKKPGEVVNDPESAMNGLFYADTLVYPYLTMSFQGERIGIQKVREEGGRDGYGEVSMSLPPEIETELFEKFPFLDKHNQITIRRADLDFDVPISGPSPQYIYINDGSFFNDPDRVYRYSAGEEEKEVTPRELLDFLREKRVELAA